MSERRATVEILMADDDPDDRLMTRKALTENHVANGLRFVENGEELLDYLRHRGKFADPATSPEPGLVLLDLNMPRKDGREALAEIKEDPELRHIPVVILTTSRAKDDIVRSYHLGVNSYIIKPASFHDLVKALQVLTHYWLEIVELPARGRRK